MMDPLSAPILRYWSSKHSLHLNCKQAHAGAMLGALSWHVARPPAATCAKGGASGPVARRFHSLTRSTPARKPLPSLVRRSRSCLAVRASLPGERLSCSQPCN